MSSLESRAADLGSRDNVRGGWSERCAGAHSLGRRSSHRIPPVLMPVPRSAMASVAALADVATLRLSLMRTLKRQWCTWADR